MQYHKSVLLKESIDALEVSNGGVYVDTTFGGGGHSREILSRVQNCSLYSFDQDEDALENELDDERLTLIHSNFSELENSLKLYRVDKVDGVLADLGVSSHQFDSEQRGFSIRFDGPLDMRMGKEIQKTASDIICEYSWEELSEMLRSYSDLKGTGRIARRIKEVSELSPLRSTSELVEVLKKMAPANKHNKFLAQVFQAFRIEVNDEMQVLKDMLNQTIDVLKPGGKLVVISYHSIEDRLVKNFMRSGSFNGEEEKDFFGNSLSPFNMITRKPIVPSSSEIDENNRARSAKLRVAKKV
ncbi:MAG: 16S rRNA (cytosine(1402)-N(4))-methyltransferase [Flavobacteriales bacterium]|nr:16S rRNA (cytosine(1402)-N(4))-methyltransferase [Flavobacteriales bacterium]MBO73156.1 16S rRNA (cytosine(1402)-N(4))-methyltransferase [Flavobacteriales bacterium]|tara:strand:+ start:2967 stop:3863 length:897 start_codon:yes stop_codon:yes gene_type:complete